MRISGTQAQAMAQLADPRRTRQAPRPVPLAELGARLPGAVVARLAGLMAQDPGLAEAVSAQLPAARRDSAHDLASCGAPPTQLIDIRS